jgi:hypothetical protein
MWTYIITRVIPADKTIDFQYEVLKDGVAVGKSNMVFESSQLASIPSDGREDYIKSVISERCKPYMVIADVKDDFSGMIGVEVALETVKYETKADVQARVESMKAVAI